MSFRREHFGAYSLLRTLPAMSLLQQHVAEPEDDSSQRCVLVALDDRRATDLEMSLFFHEQISQEARLRHDAIVPVREIGSWGDRPYLVYEQRSGVSLDVVFDAVARGGMEPLPAAIAATIIWDLIEALQSAHDSGMPHRGIWAGLVTIDPSGDLWVSGFSEGALVAKYRPSAPEPKRYAPEVRRDQAVEVTADCYGVGALLYRLLTGKPQPDEWEPRWAGMMMELSLADVPGDSLGRAIHFLHRALAERPMQRYASIDQLAQAFKPLLEEMGGPKHRALVAQALSSFFIKESVPEHTRPIATPALVSRPHHRLPATDEANHTPVFPSRMAPLNEDAVEEGVAPRTRVLANRSRSSLRSLSPALRDRVAPHPLEILARTRYQVLDELGVGGTGTVYKVLDTTLNEVLALKLLRADLIDHPGWLQRFKRELQIARDLEHPNIAPAYHLEQVEGLYFFTMRYIDGETLHQRIRSQGPMGIEEGVRVFSRVGEALLVAHENDIIHRDIKSANVMIERVTGTPYLMDFGIALAPDSQGLTITGQGIGTPMYMAPEQALGHRTGPRADIYSFGVVLYEAFGGALPFIAGTTVAVYTAQINADYLPLSARNSALPKALVELVQACMQPKADDRPTSMQEVLGALKLLLMP